MHLHKTAVTAKGLSHLTKLPNLEAVRIDGELNDDALKQLAAIPNLKSLTLNSSKHITDVGVEFLGKAKTLEQLELDRSKITDNAALQLANLENLRTLSLYETAISDKGLQRLSKLRHLGFLILKRTDVTAKGIDAFKEQLPERFVSHSPRT